MTICSLLLSMLLALSAAGAEAFRPAAPGRTWSFPLDHWAHRDYRTEWWYFTGHLSCDGDPEPRFGYQLTFFRIGLLGRRPDLDSAWAADGLIMGHAAVTDLAAGEHRFSDLLRREVPLLGGFGAHPDPRIAWARAPAGTDGIWSLTWNGSAFDLEMSDAALGISFALETRPEKPLVLQGPGGYSRKGESAASLYYSFTRLSTSGGLTVGGRSCAARGSSWMDREFGSSQLEEDQVGWDWFSLQLGDGRDLMLTMLRRADGREGFRNGTIVSAEGTPRYLDPEEWSVVVEDRWTSRETGATYPSRWRIAIPAEGISLEVVPRIAAQENVGRGGPYYWEGSVEAMDGAGRPAGRGYVELTGYGENNRPPI